MVVRAPRRNVLRRVIGVLFGATALTGMTPRPGSAHPLHTSFAELTYDPSARVLNVSLRVFADDFSADVLRRTGTQGAVGGVPPDAAVFRYVLSRFAVVTARGEGLAFGWCGLRRVGVQLFICLRAPTSVPPLGARVRSAILSETFTDQVNIVQASVEGRRQTLLFTPGDGLKPL